MKSREIELNYLYLLGDLAVLNFSLVFVGWIDLEIHVRNFTQISTYILHGNLSWFITYFVFANQNLYLRGRFYSRFLRISKRQFIFYVVAAALAVVYDTQKLHRSYFLHYTLLFYGIRMMAYWLGYKYLQYKRSKGINTLRTLIIGCNKTGFLLKRILESNPMFGYNFVGFACSDHKVESDLLGRPKDLEKLIDKHNIGIVFVTFSFFSNDTNLFDNSKILEICNRKGIRLRLVPHRNLSVQNKISHETIGGLVAFNPQEIPLDYVGGRVLKRMFDILFSGLVILLLFSWLFPIVALLIRLDSKGPIFFKQKRTGYNNQDFNCLKFRSMKVNGESDSRQATANDDRITKFGAFLRKSNIDELPQFINVFIGHMSVVGPRPHMLKHTEQYSALIGNYLVRHYVKPGITGWAQVNGLRGETKELSAMERRVDADVEYMEKWSLPLDLQIVWLTIFGKTAYKNAG